MQGVCPYCNLPILADTVRFREASESCYHPRGSALGLVHLICAREIMQGILLERHLEQRKEQS